MSTFALIKEQLRNGAVTHYGGEAALVLADRLDKSVGEIRRCLFRMHDNGEVTLEPSKGYIVNIALCREVRFTSERGRRESKYATSAEGRHYHGTLKDHQVGELTVRTASNRDEYVSLFGYEPPQGMFTEKEEVIDLTQQPIQEVTEMAPTPPQVPISLRANTIGRMEAGQLLQLHLLKLFTGEPVNRNQIIDAAIDELGLSEYQVSNRLIDLEHVHLVTSERTVWQGELHITAVSERMLDEIDMAWLLKYRSNVAGLERKERIPVLLAAAKWAIGRNADQPFSMTGMFTKLGLGEGSARSLVSDLISVNAIVRVKFHGRKGAVYAIGENIDNPEKVYDLILSAGRNAEQTPVKETSSAVESSPEPPTVTTATQTDLETPVEPEATPVVVTEQTTSVSLNQEVFDQLVARAKQAEFLEEQCVKLGNQLASQADLIAGRDAMHQQVQELLAEQQQRDEVKDMTSMTIDDLLQR